MGITGDCGEEWPLAEDLMLDPYYWTGSKLTPDGMRLVYWDLYSMPVVHCFLTPSIRVSFDLVDHAEWFQVHVRVSPIERGRAYINCLSHTTKGGVLSTGDTSVWSMFMGNECSLEYLSRDEKKFVTKGIELLEEWLTAREEYYSKPTLPH